MMSSVSAKMQDDLRYINQIFDKYIWLHRGHRFKDHRFKEYDRQDYKRIYRHNKLVWLTIFLNNLAFL